MKLRSDLNFLRYNLFFLGISLFLTISDLHAGNSGSTPPAILHAYIGGVDGPNYKVIYDGRDIRYFHADSSFKINDVRPKIIPAKKLDWTEFNKSISKIDFTAWDHEYRDFKVSDGTSWSVIIVFRDFETSPVLASGSNAYPEQFDLLLAAISTLIENRRFR